MKDKSLFAILIIIIIGLALWGLMLVLTWGDCDPNELLVDLGKNGASLSLISAIGGLIQLVLKNRETKKQEERERLDFYRNILSDLKSVYDKVEKARFLIEAHRTAQIYGEHMRELIDGVVILKNIKRALNPRFKKIGKDLNDSIDEMINFIESLLFEYRDNYKRISDLQDIDDAKVEMVKSENTETESKEIPSSAWIQIKALKNLKVLRDENELENYESVFKKHLDDASEVLRNEIPVEEEQPKLGYIERLKLRWKGPKVKGG